MSPAIAHPGPAQTEGRGPAWDPAIADRIADRAGHLTQLAPGAAARLLRACLPRLHGVAGRWIAAARHSKHLGDEHIAEEYLASLWPLMRFARLLADSLAAIDRDGAPRLGRGCRLLADGRCTIPVFPASCSDSLFFPGMRADVLLQPGVDPVAARAAQAVPYRTAMPARLTAILGAGNVAAIPALDALSRLFVERSACVVKVSPVNAWVAPLLNEALAPLVEAGYVDFLAGDATVGESLVRHPRVAAVCLTGSARTYERVRQACGPDLPILAELGNVTPAIIVPARYTPRQMTALIEQLAAMIINNGGFNCVSPRLLVTCAAWPQRQELLDRLQRRLAAIPPRYAYYPGAIATWQALCQDLQIHPAHDPSVDGCLPWTLVPDALAGTRGDRLITAEQFCPVVGETALAAASASAFLDQATAFVGERLWGTLGAMVMVPPQAQGEAATAAALDRFVATAPYGIVGINVWAGVAFAMGTVPWGAHPDGGGRQRRSGHGFTHNSFMLGAVEKTVVRAPLVAPLMPLWYWPQRFRAGAIGPLLLDHERQPGVMTAARIAIRALL